MPFRHASEEGLVAQIEQLEAELVPLRESVGKEMRAREQHEERKERLAQLVLRGAEMQGEVARLEETARTGGRGEPSSGSNKVLSPPSLLRDSVRITFCGALFFLCWQVFDMPVVFAAPFAAFPTVLGLLWLSGWRGEGL